MGKTKISSLSLKNSKTKKTSNLSTSGSCTEFNVECENSFDFHFGEVCGKKMHEEKWNLTQVKVQVITVVFQRKEQE